MNDPKHTVSDAFAAARARLHDARRLESKLGFDLMVEFIKYRQGEVSSSALQEQFKKWGMPYPASLYLTAREKAGVPIKKALNNDSGTRSYKKKLDEDFRDLLMSTPEAKRPRFIEAVHEATALAEAPNHAPAGPAPEAPRTYFGPGGERKWESKTDFSLRDVSTEDLMAELQRREDEATRLLQRLGKLPKEEEQKP